MATLKLKRLKILIEVPIFRREILVLLGYSQQQVINELLDWNDTDFWVKGINKHAFNSNGITSIRPSDGCVLLWCVNMLDTVGSYSTLVHESFHATEFILDFIGAKHRVDYSNEVYAYLQHFIVENVFRELAKYKL